MSDPRDLRRTPLDALVARVRSGAALTEAQESALGELAATARLLQTALSARTELEGRPSSMPRLECDLSTLVREAARPLLPQAARAGVRIDAHMRPNVQVVVDPVKMTWVLASLLGNALRYSPRHSEILVLVSTTRSNAEIRIVDHGPGIAPHLQEHLFDGGGGRGLTLVLIGEIVEGHGGTIAVRSDLGAGTTFVLTLPAKPGPLDPEGDERAWTLDPESTPPT